jgi:hypothetical protein
MDIFEVVRITKLANVIVNDNNKLNRKQEEEKLFLLIKLAAERGESIVYFELDTNCWNQDNFINHIGEHGKGYGLSLISHDKNMSKWKVWWHHKIRGNASVYSEPI